MTALSKISTVQFFLSASTLLLVTNSCFKDKQEKNSEQDKPNLIFVLADDLGWGDLSMNGQDSFSTPTIDQMAREGITFTNFYTGSTVSAPSRASLLTGKHTGHTSVRGNARGQLVGDNEMTLAKVMKKAGYTTGKIGKWGIGNPPPVDDPERKGFDYFYGYINMYHAHNFYPEFLYHNGEKVKLDNKLKLKNGENPWENMPEGTGVAEVKKEYAPFLFDQKGLNFIEKHQNEPFFLFMSYNTPHANNEKKPNGMEVPSYGRFADKNWPDPEKGFAKMIVNLDRSMEKILKKLKELEINNNTIVIFCSDNGPHAEGGHKMEYFNSNGELRGMKRDLYDGGIRTPFIVRWPDVIEPGQQSDHLGAFWDVLPTLADLVNADIPEETDGISFLPTLKGNPARQKQHEYLYWEFPPQGGKRAMIKDNWKAVKLHARDNKPAVFELYNIETDPYEKNNLADKHPEVVKKLKHLFDRAHEERK